MSVTLPVGVPGWGQDLVRQLRQVLSTLENKPTYNTVSALGSFVGQEGRMFFVRDIDGAGTPGFAYSDGASWRRIDTNATL